MSRDLQPGHATSSFRIRTIEFLYGVRNVESPDSCTFEHDMCHWVLLNHRHAWRDKSLHPYLVTPIRALGASPYFAAHGVHPLISLDIAEANYLCPAPTSMMSTTELIGYRARQFSRRAEDIERMQSRVYASRVKGAKARSLG